MDLLSLGMRLQGLKYGVEKFEVFSLSEVIFGAISHILDLLSLFTYRSKVVESNFKQSLVSESGELFNRLSLIDFLLESYPPLCKRHLEYAHTFFLEDPHHLSIQLSLILPAIMINLESLECKGTNF